MRKSETNRLKLDLTKPINKDDIEVTSDCFGKEYLPSASECSVCAVHEVCGIISTEAVKKLNKKVKKKTENFVDEWNFDFVPTDKILDLIVTNPYEYTTEAIHEVIVSKSKCEDAATTIAWLKNFIVENGLGTKDGKIYKK